MNSNDHADSSTNLTKFNPTEDHSMTQDHYVQHQKIQTKDHASIEIAFCKFQLQLAPYVFETAEMFHYSLQACPCERVQVMSVYQCNKTKTNTRL